MLDNETINIPKLTAAAAHLLLKQIFSHHCPKWDILNLNHIGNVIFTFTGCLWSIIYQFNLNFQTKLKKLIQ